MPFYHHSSNGRVYFPSQRQNKKMNLFCEIRLQSTGSMQVITWSKTFQQIIYFTFRLMGENVTDDSSQMKQMNKHNPQCSWAAFCSGGRGQGLTALRPLRTLRKLHGIPPQLRSSSLVDCRKCVPSFTEKKTLAQEPCAAWPNLWENQTHRLHSCSEIRKIITIWSRLSKRKLTFFFSVVSSN